MSMKASLWLRSILGLWQRHWVRWLIGIVGMGLIADGVFPFRVNPPYSTLVMATDSTVLHAFLNEQDKWRLYTEVPEISPTLRKALIYKEDRWFWWHWGVNPLAIGRAAFNNLVRGKRTSGASTITMQVVRLLEPRKRTYASKGVEILRALQLELHYSKEEILQLYLNLVPYGSNIEGIKSASLLYFNKLPQVLSLAEVTTLCIIPNRPSSLRLGQNNAYIVQERNKWLRRFEQDGLFAPGVITDALREPLQARRHEAPKQAPHLSLRLKKQLGEQPIVRTTLVRSKQQLIEQLCAQYVNRLRGLNIKNAALLVVNNQTHHIEAYVGSADFAATDDGGQVDGIRAVRSPGSTLKPLLYATAFDRGLLSTRSILNDVPSNFEGYQPENFDRTFHGKITVGFALANSLNVPAVKVLKDLSTPVLIDKLKKANFENIKKNAPLLGYSMILGGCGVTLEELTNLYAAFANQGQLIAATPLAATNLGAKEEVVSPEAAYLITQVLSQVSRPDLPNNYDYTYRLPKIAWKTGTSFGKKDAWSIGYNARYTVGVWVGNFSGEGVPELNGANIATPLLFEVFNSLDYNSVARWFGMPRGLYRRKVCPESGDVPNTFCTNTVLDYYLPGTTRTQLCQHLKPVWVSAAQSLSYCTHCLPDSGAVRRLFPNLPPDLVSWYEAKHIQYLKVPLHNPACTRVFAQNAPQVVSPNDGGEYFVDQKDPQQLSLSCLADNEVKTVYWYINDKLLAQATPTENVFFNPKAGRIKISCADDKGRNANIWITVKWQ
jgi:penicillin-binding protein 1C